jgi:transcriptional regulator with XRE-family HTH domain
MSITISISLKHDIARGNSMHGKWKGLQALAEYKGVNQDTLAKTLGYKSNNAISSYWHGVSHQRPNLRTVEKWATILHMDIRDLLIVLYGKEEAMK